MLKIAYLLGFFGSSLLFFLTFCTVLKGLNPLFCFNFFASSYENKEEVYSHCISVYITQLNHKLLIPS